MTGQVYAAAMSAIATLALAPGDAFGAGTQARPMPVEFLCETVDSQPLTDEGGTLCGLVLDALRSVPAIDPVRVASPSSGADTIVRLVLVKATGRRLVARLEWAAADGQGAGPELAAAVVDRDTLPPSAIAALARRLVTETRIPFIPSRSGP